MESEKYGELIFLASEKYETEWFIPMYTSLAVMSHGT